MTQPLLDIYPKDSIANHRDTYTSMFMITVFIIFSK